jgi:hypothetical protein
MLQGPASPASPAPDRLARGGGGGARPDLDRSPLQLGYLEEHDAAVAEAGGRGADVAGGLHRGWSAGRGWRGSLQRTSMQLREGLLGVPEGALPMGDATGQAGLTLPSPCELGSLGARARGSRGSHAMWRHAAAPSRRGGASGGRLRCSVAVWRAWLAGLRTCVGDACASARRP